MALKNTTVAANIRHGKYGRPGRPLGAKDTVPRKGKEKDRFNALQAELGKAYKRIEALENELQYGAKFTGDNMRDLLLAHARGEYNATNSQLYAAKAVYDREPPVVAPEQVETEAEREKRRKEMDEYCESLAHCIAIEMARRLTEKKLPKAGGSPAIVTRAVDKVLAELEAEIEAEKAGHTADMVPMRRVQHAELPRQNGASATDYN
jgi:hypothetical protein